MDTAKNHHNFYKNELRNEQNFGTNLLILIDAEMFVHVFAKRLDVREILVASHFADRLKNDVGVRTRAAAHRHLKAGEDGDEHFLQRMLQYSNENN